ncbi:MAG: ABC transporter substrate-binding protein [Thermoplasmata archaeon]|nr:ABC transporter substrate-binding protein [Euryarchaeota archaeon]RLF66963.1 MAG: ABC transporter substrate-binding protein [Thermoplasmata archaeon]
MTKRILWPLLVVSILLVSSFAGCVGGGQEEEITLVILTRHDTTIQMKVKQAFLSSDIAKKYHIGDIKFKYTTPGEWKTCIEEGAADVAWGGGPTVFDDLYLEGYLQPLDMPELLQYIEQHIPKKFAGFPTMRTDESGKIYWVGAALSSFGFTVNHDKLLQLGLPKPEKWEDLASETFALEPPQVGTADPTKSTSNTRIFEIILQAFGWEEGWRILTLMAANARIYDASDSVREGVIAGEIAVGTTIDFYGYTAMKSNPACEYVVPSGQSIVNADPIALVKNAPHKEAAQAFILWVLSPEGQKIWLDPQVNRMPINPEVFNTPEGQQRSDLKKAYDNLENVSAIPFNDTLALMVEITMQYYFKATLVDMHDLLHSVWVQLVEAKRNGKITDDQFEQLKKKLTDLLTFKDPRTGETVTFTLEWAKENNEYVKNNPDDYLSVWRTAAEQKYNEVLNELKSITG